jgi:hypothetical protein
LSPILCRCEMFVLSGSQTRVNGVSSCPHLGKGITVQIFKFFFLFLILPKIDFCNTIWHNVYSKRQNKTLIFHNSLWSLHVLWLWRHVSSMVSLYPPCKSFEVGPDPGLQCPTFKIPFILSPATPSL